MVRGPGTAIVKGYHPRFRCPQRPPKNEKTLKNRENPTSPQASVVAAAAAPNVRLTARDASTARRWTRSTWFTSAEQALIT